MTLIDWPGLMRAIAATGCERVIVTHGDEAVMVRWLRQQGLQAGSFRTEYGDDVLEVAPAAGADLLARPEPEAMGPDPVEGPASPDTPAGLVEALAAGSLP